MTTRNQKPAAAEQAMPQEYQSFIRAWLAHLTPSQQRVILLLNKLQLPKESTGGNKPALKPRRDTDEEIRGPA